MYARKKGSRREGLKKILVLLTLFVLLTSACVPHKASIPSGAATANALSVTLTPYIPQTGSDPAQQALKARWQPVIIPYAYLEGICNTTQEIVRGSQRGDIDSGSLPGDIIGIRAILVITNQVISSWQPAPDFASEKTKAAAYLSNISRLVDQWVNGSLTGGEMSVQIAAVCSQVTQDSRDTVAAAQAGGVSLETLRAIGDEFQKSLAANEQATPTPPADAPGLTPQYPFPAGSAARTPDLQIQVFDVVRGAAAQQMILSANPANSPAPQGLEYVLARIHVKNVSTALDPLDIHPSLFKLTGAQAVQYDVPSAAAPDPALDARLNPNDEAEGWVPLIAAKDETSLVLVIQDIYTNEANKTRYLALQPGAALSVPAGLSRLQPTGTGTKRGSPARKGETVVTQQWVVTLTNVARGDAAWKMIRQADPAANPPAQGMEYVLAMVKARYIGSSITAQRINQNSFTSTGSANQTYAPPSVAVPDPALDARLFPGGEMSGWVPLLAKQGETGLVLVFKPFELYDTNQRFLSLEP